MNHVQYAQILSIRVSLMLETWTLLGAKSARSRSARTGNAHIHNNQTSVNFKKCYCDENFAFCFPVFLSVISYLDPKFHESAKFFTI